MPARQVNASICYMLPVKRIFQFFLILAIFSALGLKQAQAAKKLPNILWITSEDNGPHLGCYGDAYALSLIHI